MLHKWAINKLLIAIFLMCCFSSSSFSQMVNNAASVDSAEVAEEENIYQIKNISISAAADSATKSREKAIAYGQRQGFSDLFKKLGIDEEFANNVSDELIADMVASQRIIDEKIAGNDYRAFLDLTFSESFVQHYLKDKKFVREISQKTDSYLVIPIKTTTEKFLIWEKENDWRGVWEGLVKNNKNSSLKLPDGDIEDITIFNPGTIYAGNFNMFENAFSKYRVNGVILAYFDFDNIENKVDITLKMIRKYRSKKIRLDFVNVNQLSYQDLAIKVAQRTAHYLITTQDNLKKTAENQSVAMSSGVTIDVLISNLGDWMAVKRKLENENIVSGLKVVSISSNLIKINVSFKEENVQMVDFFAGHDLFLHPKLEGGYFLTMTN
ncbi:MAG: hypothetical protein ACJAW3_000456 [Lentimonas sp.]|jgi:hypothetical protein